MADLAAIGVHTFSLDVTKDDSVQAAFEEISLLAKGKLDLLFNNAGGSCTMPAIDLNLPDAEACFAVNVFGVIRVTKVFMPLIIEAKGTVVQTGSLAGVVPFPFASVYCASKAALHQYSSVLRLEMAPFGVKVVTLMSGGVRTEIGDSRPLPDNSLYSDIDGLQVFRDMSKNNNPMEPPEFAKAVISRVCGPAPKSVYWVGSGAAMMRFVTSMLPKFVLESTLSRKFELNKLATILANKQKKF